LELELDGHDDAGRRYHRHDCARRRDAWRNIDMTRRTVRPQVFRIESLRVENHRALTSLDLKQITPLTVLLGPNGSGKSTVFDAFAFMSECFSVGLRKAWDKRGRFKGG
jgi:predicted ATPase